MMDKKGFSQVFVLLFFFISGFAGLIYQVLWARQFKLLLGSSITSISIVIGAFMLGLLAGAWFIGRKLTLDKKINEIRLYGFLELGIGLYSLLLLVGFDSLTPIFSFFGETSTAFNYTRLIGNSILTLILLIPPTFAMGATLPLLINFFNRSENTFRNSTAKLYSVNALGGAVASLLAGFYLIKNYGVNGAILVAVTMNLIIGSLSLLASKTLNARKITTKDEVKKNPIPIAKKLISSKSILGIAFLTGFISISYEVLWIRCLNYILNNSTYTFSIILFTFLFGIALGSYWVSLIKNKINNYLSLAFIQYGMAVLSVLLIFLFYSFGNSEFISSLLSKDEIEVSLWYQDIGANLFFSIIVFLLPTILMGLSFPLIAELYFNANSERAGSAISRVYVYNTFGSILGAIVPIFILIPLLNGIKPSLLLLSIINLLFALFFLLKSMNQKRWLVSLIGVIGFVILVSATQSGKELISIEGSSPSKTMFYKEGKMATIKAYLDKNQLRALSIDDVTIASDAFKAKESTIAHLPFFTNQARNKILVVGLASGSTTYSILKHKEVEKVDVVEIVPSVLNTLPYFKPKDQNLLTNSKVEIYIDDIISHLNHSDEKYDVISSDGKFSVLNKANTVMLSKDYYQLCKKHLNDNGIFTQWVSLKIPSLYFKTILATTESVFDYSEMFLVRENMFILSSSKPIFLTKEKIDQAFLDATISQDLYQSNLYSSNEVISSYAGPNNNIYETEKLNTFNTPYIEYGYNEELQKDIDSHGISSLKNLEFLLKGFEKNKSLIQNSDNTISKNINEVSFNKNRSFINSRINYIKGLRANTSADLNAAIKFLDIIIKENHPDNINDIAVAAKTVGEIYLNKEKYSKAIPYFNIAIEKINNFELAYLLRGIAKYKLNLFSESKEDFMKVIELNPNNQAANQYLKLLNK